MAVTFTNEGPIGFITLDHPPANSYDLAYMTEFSSAVDEAVDGPTRVVIVQSANPKFFCAGADIKRFLEGDIEANMEMIRVSQAAFRRMAAAQQVFIAYMAGHALGGGLEIALACDIRLAATGGYKMGLPEVTLGILPGNGGTQRLPRLIGIGPALELLTIGRQLAPEEALRLGLVSQVFADQAAFDEHAAALRRGLPPLALDHIKRAVYEGVERPLADGLALERDLIEDLFNSQDAREGLTAFSEKRAAEFVGA
jgi:enoyl-CoA hydratase/carnithine racemase